RLVQPESGQSGRMADGSQNQIPGLIRSRTMTDEQAQAIGSELKRIAGDLNLSDERKTKLRERMAFAAGRLHEYKKSHPDVTRQDIINALRSQRTELREGLERFLTPEQLKKWDAEVAKRKSFSVMLRREPVTMETQSGWREAFAPATWPQGSHHA